MTGRSATTVGRRRPMMGAVLIAGSLLLTGCDGMDDLSDLQDTIDQVQEAIDDLAETDPDNPSEFQQEMSKAREEASYPEPPDDIDPLEEDPFMSYVDQADGSRDALEEYAYGSEYTETLERYYSEEYGQDPTTNADGDLEWSDDDSTTVLEEQPHLHRVKVQSTWHVAA
ncbi:hypothetical protein P0L94_08080 [Microbacter sp. GSS18]|nr:hypothetical protein P0L94_08080 [Microbacter sp. GSS18]